MKMPIRSIIETDTQKPEKCLKIWEFIKQDMFFDIWKVLGMLGHRSTLIEKKIICHLSLKKANVIDEESGFNFARSWCFLWIHLTQSLMGEEFTK